eukprot:CAMPEP_0194064424 /NCGR_PEP_ID=MMETSP0009_2-20130614/82999_1 /TAXON_ID=210454 /ORGANISM="Grammatophora oceanica, Strain CCMP 410" /LENGTH=71 /DNA_ID=CAMNT_0038716895 /DNA_START=21 /DNA_END=232 /DNA_ORIENTATION=-
MTFAYEVELTPGTTMGELSSDILPFLEASMLASILPALIDEDCTDDPGHRQLLRSRRLVVTGATASPPDVP